MLWMWEAWSPSSSITVASGSRSPNASTTRFSQSVVTLPLKRTTGQVDPPEVGDRAIGSVELRALPGQGHPVGHPALPARVRPRGVGGVSEAREDEEVRQLRVGHVATEELVHERLDPTHLLGTLAELPEDPVGGGLDESQRPHSLGVLDRELDGSTAAARPAGQMDVAENERVEGQAEGLPLGLVRVAMIAGHSHRPELVVDGLHPDRAEPLREALLVGNPREPAGQATRHEHDGLPGALDVVGQAARLHRQHHSDRQDARPISVTGSSISSDRRSPRQCPNARQA